MSWEDLANDDIPKSEEAPKFTDTTDDIQDDAWNEEEVKKISISLIPSNSQ